MADKPITELLYKDGCLATVWEHSKDGVRNYGRAETPLNGYVVVRVYCAAKDIPSQFLEHGAGSCRFMLDETRMTEDEVLLFKDMERYKFKDHKKKHTITKERLALLLVDNSEEWEMIGRD